MGSPTSCIAKGRPRLSIPEGIEIAGKPEKLQGWQKAGLPVEEIPLGAVEGAVGINAASTEDNLSPISLWKISR